MPSLYHAGISAGLATLPLSVSGTRKTVNKKGAEAARLCEEAEKKLRASEFLVEERVQFPGDDENFAVNWIGEAPFLQVVVGGEQSKVREVSQEAGRRSSARNKRVKLPEAEPRHEQTAEASSEGRRIPRRAGRVPSQTTGKNNERTPDQSPGLLSVRPSTRAHPRPPLAPRNLVQQTATALRTLVPDTDIPPKALVLHVELTKKTFYESLIDGSRQHLKLDVFFNGQLAGCVLVHQNDIRTGVKSMHQIFAGTRVDYMAERPWVILPPSANGFHARNRDAKNVYIEQRWSEISRGLMEEANLRGVDENGLSPPSAAYLKELASMYMPDEVKDMQKPGGRRFGIMDVIVTVGLGRKVNSGTSYLTQPARLIDDRFSYEVIEDLDGKDGLLGEVTEGRRSLRNLRREQQQKQIECVKMVVDSHGNTCGRQESDPPLETPAPAPRPSPTLEGLTGLPHHPTFHNPFNTAHIPVVPPPVHFPSPSMPPFYSSSQGGSPGSIANQRIEVQPRKRSFNDFVETASEAPTRNYERTSSLDSQQSFPPTPFSMNSQGRMGPIGGGISGYSLTQYDGFTHANPYQLPFEDMMQGLDFGATANFGTFGETVATPFPPVESDQAISTPFNSSSTGSLGGAGSNDLPLASRPFVLPSNPSNHGRQVSFRPANITSFQPESPSIATSSSIPQPLDSPGTMFGSSPMLLPGFPPSFPRPRIPPSMYPPGPPPAVGLFSATTKPKTVLPKEGLMPSKGSDPAPRLVKRLLITGKGGATVVDHKWHSPQRIPIKVGQSGSSQLTVRSQSPSKHPKDRLSSAEPAISNFQSKASIATTTMPPSSPDKDTTLATVETDMEANQNAVNDYNVVSEPTEPVPVLSPLDPALALPTAVAVPISSKEEGEAFNSNPPIAGDAESTRRRVATNSIQGPKAKTFVLDNPEELLRKAPKPRSSINSGSQSPVKRDEIPVERISRPRSEAEVGEAGVMSEHRSSFSLPGAPSSSAAQANINIGQATTVLPLQSSGLSPSVISAQLPSSSTPILPTQTFDPPRLVPSTPTPTGPLAQTLVKKSASLQRFTGPRIRDLRTSNRLNTSENPPLNQDCVIQYAVSETEGGALRQIKMERQGMFTEESVVVGMRFFVRGQ